MIQLLIQGDDYLFNKHLQTLLKKIAPLNERDFNFDRLSAKQHGLSQILSIYKTPPMMANSRTLVIEDLEALDKNEQEILAKTLDAKMQDCHVVLITEKIDKRTQFYKSLAKVAEVFEFKKPYPNQIPQFLETQAQSLGLKLSSGVHSLLIDAVGTDLMSLIQELEKLQIAIMPQQTITVQEVKQYVANGILENIFDFTQALAEKNLKKSYSLFQRYHEQGEPIIMTVALIISHFRKLLLTKEASLQKNNEPLEKILGISPYFVKDYLAQSQAFSIKELNTIYKNLMTVSVQLRSVKMDPKRIMENFIQDVCLKISA